MFFFENDNENIPPQPLNPQWGKGEGGKRGIGYKTFIIKYPPPSYHTIRIKNTVSNTINSNCDVLNLQQRIVNRTLTNRLDYI